MSLGIPTTDDPVKVHVPKGTVYKWELVYSNRFLPTNAWGVDYGFGPKVARHRVGREVFPGVVISHDMAIVTPQGLKHFEGQYEVLCLEEDDVAALWEHYDHSKGELPKHTMMVGHNGQGQNYVLARSEVREGSGRKLVYGYAIAGGPVAMLNDGEDAYGEFSNYDVFTLQGRQLAELEWR